LKWKTVRENEGPGDIIRFRPDPSFYLGFHNMFAGRTIFDGALAAGVFRRSFFSRYHPCASGSFRHFIIPLLLNFY
jgi:hypothetical protein